MGLAIKTVVNPRTHVDEVMNYLWVVKCIVLNTLIEQSVSCDINIGHFKSHTTHNSTLLACTHCKLSPKLMQWSLDF